MAEPYYAQTERCRHCAAGAHITPPLWRYGASVPAVRNGDSLPVRRGRAELDELTDDEAWLWRLVEEAERVHAAAPAAPDPQRVAEADRALTQAAAFDERIRMQIRAAQAALAHATSWLRPSYRAAIVRQLRQDRATAVGAAIQRERAAEICERLRAMAARRAAYLAENRVTLAAGRNARSELLQLIDELIEGYACLDDQPAWFRFGLGRPDATPNWLQAAREAVAVRRRTALADLSDRISDF